MVRLLPYRIALFGSLCLLPSHVLAHINIAEPPPRSSSSAAGGPCTTDDFSEDPSVFDPGAVVTVAWRESIDHDATYRIAIASSDEALAALDDPEIEVDEEATILLEDIPDAEDHEFSYDVTLPDAPCARCTIQVSQMLTGSSVAYIQCADVIIGEPDVTTTGAGSTGGGSTGGGDDDSTDGSAEASAEGSEAASTGVDDDGASAEASDGGSPDDDDDDDDASAATGTDGGCRVGAGAPSRRAGGIWFVMLGWWGLAARKRRREAPSP